MRNWQPMKTAPRDGTRIIVLARWDWDDMDEPTEKHEPAFAVWNDRAQRFFGGGFNPYVDYAVDPLGWMPSPNADVSTAKDLRSAPRFIEPG